MMVFPALIGLLAGCVEVLPMGTPDIPDRADRACDVVEQDCGSGEKCGLRHDRFAIPVWYAGPSSLAPVEPAECVEETGTAGLEEDCTVDPQTGLDDCAAGLSCFTVDAEQTTGSCLALCSPGAETCGDVGLPDHVCRTSHIDAPGMCFADCHPVTDGCEGDWTCQLWYEYPENYDEVCLPPGSLGYGEACGAERCGDGLDCLDNVCTSHCQTAAPQDCPSGYCLPYQTNDPADEGLGYCWVEGVE